ncbi:MAG: TonB-dependent receptor [Bacteroidota bacterium]
MKKQFYFLFFFILSIQISFAQSGSVKGFLYDKENGEPLLFTPVFLKGTGVGTTTDDNGFYTLNKIPPGKYFLVATAIGYDTVSAEITITNDNVLTQQFTLARRVINLKAVNISAEKTSQRTEVQVSVQKITPKEIAMVPAIGGEPDLAQYLQVLPGVVFSGDQGGQLYIRGGTPIMNKVLLDGMVVYNPFHSIGLFSVFDTDILRNADVYTGGFNAEYGDRIGAVMDISTRDGNKKRTRGKVSGSTFGSKLLIEGPIAKQKTDGGSSTTYVLSFKNSYLDKSSKVFYDYVNTNDGGLPYSFKDFYGKVSMNGENGSKFSVFGYNFQDDAKFRDIASIGWKSSGFGSHFLLVPKGSNMLMEGVFAYSGYKIQQQEASDKPRSSGVNGFNMGMNFVSYIDRNELKFGFEILGFQTSYEAQTITGLKSEQIENTTEFGSFLKYRVTRDKWVLEPSLRLQYYASLSEFSPEPRIGFKWNASDKFRFKFAGGMYSQNLLSTSSDRDVVNLFYGFLSGPETLPSQFNGKAVTSHLQKARDLVAGCEIDLLKDLDLNVETYVKDFTQLTNINRDKIYPDNGTYSNEPDYKTKDYIVESGKAYGVDFVLKYEHKRMYLWGVYSLGKVTRNDGIRTYSPHFDRRHNINLVGAYTFGKKLNWEVNVRWNYGSGFPFTKTAGFYEYLNFANGLYTDPTTANGYLGVSYGDLNQGRLPDYHRMDISVKKTLLLSEHKEMEILASLINVYNRENIFYFDRIRYKRVNQLPVLPSLGINMTF